MSDWSCPFCQRTGVKRSKEHILPRHLKDKIETHDGPVRVLSDSLETGEILREYITDHSPLDMTIREVCIDCNNGWMSRIESDLDEILVRIASGEHLSLDRDESEVLRFWAAKTALVITLREKGLEKSDHFFQMYEKQGVPRGVYVQYCVCSDLAPNVIPRHSYEHAELIGREITSRDRISLVSFGLGRAYFMIAIAGRRPWIEAQARQYLNGVRSATPGWVRLISGRSAPAPTTEVDPASAYINGSIMRDIRTGQLDSFGTETRPSYTLFFPFNDDGTVNLNEDEWPEFYANIQPTRIVTRHPLFGWIDMSGPDEECGYP